ncbi:hypothetical protein [Salinicola sp. CPA57]|uniref:hypothetical protein n=1 Tax=Salinicola sp. CPA57 TaxID=1949080 RepID=UPI000DA163EB|nr:hypothetical protein [Salinicola sp. CPA57]
MEEDYTFFLFQDSYRLKIGDEVINSCYIEKRTLDEAASSLERGLSADSLNKYSDVFLLKSLLNAHCYEGFFHFLQMRLIGESEAILSHKENIISYRELFSDNQFASIIELIASLPLSATDYLKCNYLFFNSLLALSIAYAELHSTDAEEKSNIISSAGDIFLVHNLDGGFATVPKEILKELALSFERMVVLRNKVISKNEQLVLSSLALMAGDLPLFKKFRFYNQLAIGAIDSIKISKELGEEIASVSGDAPSGFLAAALKLYDGTTDSYRHYFKRKPRYFDTEYEKILNGKSVAIVGPVDTFKENGKEIDSFDVVIRFNYKGLDGFDTARFGSRTDVSYYITADVKQIMKERRNARAIETLKYSLHSGGAYNYVKDMPEFQGRCARRLPVQKIQFNPFYHGSANAIQKTLLDILRYNPSKVKIFNANLWVDNNRVNVNYREKPNFSTAGFVYHDPVSNFCFTRGLYVASVIEADNELSGVLNLSPYEYVDKLIEAYGYQI